VVLMDVSSISAQGIGGSSLPPWILGKTQSTPPRQPSFTVAT
jgi:hypothetical protein